ncbi:MAG: SRPBCC domain-containing protein [Myxococcota bacterium]
MSAEHGRLEPDGAYATLRFERRLPHQIQHVWEAISTPEGLREWLICSQALIEGRRGGRIEMVSGGAQYHSTGKILEWDPPRLLEYEWNVDPVPEMPEGQRAIWRFELSEAEGLTILRLIYRRITLPVAQGFLPGLHAFLDRLQAQLEGRALPDWNQRFLTRIAEYPAWTPHER